MFMETVQKYVINLTKEEAEGLLKELEELDDIRNMKRLHQLYDLLDGW